MTYHLKQESRVNTFPPSPQVWKEVFRSFLLHLTFPESRLCRENTSAHSSYLSPWPLALLHPFLSAVTIRRITISWCFFPSPIMVWIPVPAMGFVGGLFPCSLSVLPQPAQFSSHRAVHSSAFNPLEASTCCVNITPT